MVAITVTYMEMTTPPAGAAAAPPRADAAIAREMLAREAYVALYKAVGGPLNWDDRLRMKPGALEAFLASATTDIHVLRLGGRPVGFCELDRSGAPDIEITNFGLVSAAQGERLGPYLLDHALRQAWSHGPRRLWLHTDVWDHPKAQPLYRRLGFRVFKVQTEDSEAMGVAIDPQSAGS